MSKELHIALQEAISDLGTDVLKSPFLVNILRSYGALIQSDTGSIQITERLGELAKKGHLEQILSWQNLSKEQIRENGRRLLNKYDNASYSKLTINAVLRALEMPVIPTDPPPTTKSSTPKPKQSYTTDSSTETSDIVLKVILVIGGIALAILLIWLISKAFFFLLVILVIIAAAKK